MAKDRNSFRLVLTPEQREQVKQATHRDAEAIELSAQELEERIAPRKMGWHPTL